MTKTILKRKTREEILDLSVSLFAKRGYDGVSMRDIAAATGLTTAALYYHFPDKENLYFDAVGYAFRERSAGLKSILSGSGTPWQRLEGFIASNARLSATDKNFQRLMQWVMLDSDEARLHKLSEQVFKDLFVALYAVAAELGAQYDPHMLAISIVGLVFFHFQAGTARQFMPGHLPRQDNPAVLAQHVIGLLHNCLGKNEDEDGHQTLA